MYAIKVADLRKWFAEASDFDIEELLQEGGFETLIEVLEEQDFFGTEGFMRRFK